MYAVYEIYRMPRHWRVVNFIKYWWKVLHLENSPAKNGCRKTCTRCMMTTGCNMQSTKNKNSFRQIRGGLATFNANQTENIVAIINWSTMASCEGGLYCILIPLFVNISHYFDFKKIRIEIGWSLCGNLRRWEQITFNQKRINNTEQYRCTDLKTIDQTSTFFIAKLSFVLRFFFACFFLLCLCLSFGLSLLSVTAAAMACCCNLCCCYLRESKNESKTF